MFRNTIAAAIVFFAGCIYSEKRVAGGFSLRRQLLNKARRCLFIIVGVILRLLWRCKDIIIFNLVQRLLGSSGTCCGKNGNSVLLNGKING
jgi:hypothetical protein